MNHQLTEWIATDDRAVSPVIGVILMVAITVILAAVIGTFVLDLGQSAGNSAPQASFQIDTTVSSNQVEIEHVGGDGIDAQDTRLTVSLQDGSELQWDEVSSASVLNVGGTATVDTDGDSVTGWGYGSSDSGSAFSFDKGDQVTVTLIDVESQRVIFETTVTA